MDNKKKNILLGILIVGVISMTIAFAAFSTSLNISGTANIAAVNWNIHFQEWQKVAISTGLNGNTNTAVSPEVSGLTMSDSSNVTKVEGIAVTLYQPGDIAKYNFEIKNDGNITAKLDNFSASLSPSSDVIGYQVKCFESNTRTGNEITTNSTLAPAGIAYCYIEIKYNDATNGAQTAGSNQVYTQSAVNTSLSASWTWVQDGVSANNNQGGGQQVVQNLGTCESLNDPHPFAGQYGYNGPGAETCGNGGNTPWVSDINPNWRVYHFNNGTAISLCVVFSGGTACYEGTAAGRESDFEDCPALNAEYTSSNSSCLKGYTKTKIDEMEAKGATCYFDINEYTTKISCYEEDGPGCDITDSGGISCTDSSSGQLFGSCDPFGLKYCEDSF